MTSSRRPPVVGAVGTAHAQAKVNLFLRVLARESGGYHQIETLFCRIDLGDDVRLRVTDGTRTLTCQGPALPPGGFGAPEENLAYRAAAAFLDRTHRDLGFHIEITKRIPVGGGLGGGSADAGAALRILAALTGEVPDAEGAQLGADVPFLSQGDCVLALGWGRGDRMLALNPLPVRECVLVTAPFGVNTGAAYGWLGPAPGSWRGGTLIERNSLESWDGVRAVSSNDFESAVFARHPELSVAASALRDAAGPDAVVRMSGSGSTLFAIAGDAGVVGEVVGLPAGFLVVRTTTATAPAPVLLAG